MTATVTHLRAHTAPTGAVMSTLAATAAGITYRQLDYWTRTGLALASIGSADGSGVWRWYSPDDITRLAIVRTLLDSGLSLPFVRQHIDLILDAPMPLILTEHVHLDLDLQAIRRTTLARLEELTA